MRFEFATATRIIFGGGTLSRAVPAAQEFGRCVLLVTGRRGDRAAPLQRELERAQLRIATCSISGEPTVEMVLQGVERARAERCDVVIGIGGGSVLDAGKAIAVLLTNPGHPLEYLEVIGQGRALTQPSVPYIAIPTTAGTGAEVTRNAVLGSPEHGVKVSLRSPTMLPRLALIDPQLTLDLPAAITASTGLDALTQVLEPFVSPQASPLTDAFCREGLQRAARSLRRVCCDGQDLAAREDMALVSLLGGLALANAKLGAVHGFAGPFGGMFPAPHGATCAALLPHVMDINIRALQARQPDSPALARYDEVARCLTGDVRATALDGAEWVRTLTSELRIPLLRGYGLDANAFPELVDKARNASSMQGNPITLTTEELTEILSRAT